MRPQESIHPEEPEEPGQPHPGPTGDIVQSQSLLPNQPRKEKPALRIGRCSGSTACLALRPGGILVLACTQLREIIAWLPWQKQQSFVGLGLNVAVRALGARIKCDCPGSCLRALAPYVQPNPSRRVRNLLRTISIQSRETAWETSFPPYANPAGVKSRGVE